MEIDTHLKLLKKFKSAVPGMIVGHQTWNFQLLYLCVVCCIHTSESLTLGYFDSRSIHLLAFIRLPLTTPLLLSDVSHIVWRLHFFVFLFGGLDYKLLMTGEDPLSILVPTLSSTNVHVIAKLANKVPCKVTVCLKHSSLVSGICT